MKRVYKTLLFGYLDHFYNCPTPSLCLIALVTSTENPQICLHSTVKHHSFSKVLISVASRELLALCIRIVYKINIRLSVKVNFSKFQ